MSAPYSCVRDLLYELKADLGDTNAPDTFNALRFLKTATDRINRRLQIRFQPFVESQQFNPTYWSIDSGLMQLNLPETMFNVTEVTDGNGSVLDPSLYFIYPPRTTPFKVIELITRAGVNPFGGSVVSWYQTVCPLYYGASNVLITGTWGWHNDYPNAWTDTLDSVQDNPLTNSASFITVDNTSESDMFGRFPRFSPGQLLKVDDEVMELTTVDTINNKLYVLRGQNGTTAVNHNQGTEIRVWDAPWDVQQATARFAGYPYKRRGDYSKGNFDPGTGVSTTLPADIPEEVMGILQSYANGVP